MGIEEEAERTLFIRNLDTRVSEELLFELFLQAGPVVRTKIPKDPDGKQKTFGFVIYKHEESVPYAMQLLNGSSLFGKNIHVLFRQGSSHNSSPANSNKPSPANTPDPHGQRTSAQFSSPQYTPPAQMQAPFSSFDNMHKQIMMSNVMWQVHMQQLEQLNGGVSKPAGGRTGVRQHDSTPYRHHSSPNSSRGQRYGGDEPGSGRQGRDGYHHHHHHHHHSDRSGGRHYDNRGGNRQYDERGGNRGYQEKWRRY